jgi:long-chain acyl-CoA synthetase
MFDFDLGPSVAVDHASTQVRTLGELFIRRAEMTPARYAHFHKPDSAWLGATWREFHEAAAKVAAGLLALGAKRGDRIAILGPTQPQWGTYDLGGQLAGMVTFGIYPKQSTDQVRYLLEHSEAKVVFVDGAEELDTVIRAVKGLSSVLAIVPWTPSLVSDRDPRIVSPARFVEAALPDSEQRTIQDAIDPDDTAILIYTSGTTGHPKGAMITHKNLVAMVDGMRDVIPYFANDLSLHFLPMAHSAERIQFYGRINSGIAGAYAKSTATVLEDLKAVRPTFFGSVPRIYEKAHAKIHSEIEKQKPAVQRMFRWASDVARRRLALTHAKKSVPLGLAAQFVIADRLVFRRIREAFGGRVRVMITGAAPTAPAILEFFHSAGLPIYEAYGMTEATCVTHLNTPAALKLGTVGRTIARMECKIAGDGEVLMRGPLVCKGYYKNPEATAELLEGGWLHTGDVGTVDADGFLKITDRKKHLIITAGGKNLSPANIEKAIKEQDPLISQVHAHGDRRNYVAAIVAPSPIETLEWGLPRGLCTQAELDARTAELLANPAGRSTALNTAMAKVVAHPEFKKRIRQAVARGNKQLAQVEQVRRFVILERDFSQEHDELTPTLKLKRKSVEQKYSSTFDGIYNEDGFALEPLT